MLNIKTSILFAIAIFIIGCNSNPNQNNIEIRVSNKKCNEPNRTNEYGYRLDNNHTYIFYKYNRENRTLYLHHYNIPFNCNKNGIEANVSIEDDSIVVKEYHHLLESEKERCMCLFDIYLKIDNIKPKEYSIDFINEEINDRISINIDLVNNLKGIKSIEQTNYPYAQRAMTTTNESTIKEIINDKFYNLDIFPNNEAIVISSKEKLEKLILNLREIGEEKTDNWADKLEKEMNLIDFNKSYIVTYTFTECIHKYITSTQIVDSKTLMIKLDSKNEICDTIVTKYFLVYLIPNRFKRVQFIIDKSKPITVYR